MLETSEVLFRGEFRLKIPFKDIQTLSSQDGELSLRFSDGTAVFELGKQAAAWEDKIRSPRGRMQKLGIKDGMKVGVLGVDDHEFIDELSAQVGELCQPGARDQDVIFYEAEEPADLGRLLELRSLIAGKGVIWVVSPKGKTARIKDTDVMAAAREAGLVDTKVVGFSDTHTALKLVIPVAKR